MQPHERIRHTFYTLLRKLLIIVGHNFIDEGGFKPNLFSFFLYVLNVLGFASCIYTFFWYDIETGLKTIGYGAVNIQVMFFKINLFFKIHCLILLLLIFNHLLVCFS